MRGVTCKDTQRPVSGGGRLSPRGASCPHLPAPDQPPLGGQPGASEVTPLCLPVPVLVLGDYGA